MKSDRLPHQSLLQYFQGFDIFGILENIKYNITKY